MSHMLSLSSPHESAKSCWRVTTRALGKESGASCQSLSWWFTMFSCISLSTWRNRPDRSIYIFAFYRTDCKEGMLSCRSRREDFFPFSRCKKIFQFLWFLPRSALASPMCGVCVSCHGWQHIRALGSATLKGMHSHSSSSPLSLCSLLFGEHQGLTHTEEKKSDMTDFVSSLFQGGKKSAILNCGNEICGCRLQNVCISLGRALLPSLYTGSCSWDSPILHGPKDWCREGIHTGCDATLFLYFISSFSGCTV